MSSLRIDAPSGQSRVDVGPPLAQTEMWGRTPTIYDVARMAGVAPSTVSRALSRPDRVRYQTAEHVRRAAAELGYRKGHLDRVLSERGTRVLVFVVADIANPVYFGMIRGAERAASDRGFTVLGDAFSETRKLIERRDGLAHRVRGKWNRNKADANQDQQEWRK